MKINNKIIISILLISIAILVIWFFANKQKVDDSSSFLPQIFPNSEIKVTKEVDHYFIDSKEYYTKEITVAGTTFSLVVENYKDQGSIYRFYSSSPNPKLLKKIGSLIPPENSEQVFNQNFSMKDITGDGIDELFVKLQTTGSNLNSYEILQIENGSLVNIKLSGENNNWVDFDEISYKDGYTYITLHDIPVGGYSIWKTRYTLNKGILSPIEIIEFSLIEGTEDNCEISKSMGDTKFTIIAKEKCSVLGTNFDQYFK